MPPTRTRTRTRRAIETPDDVMSGIAEIEKVHGAGIVRFGNTIPRCNHIPTGCFIVDFALLGGYPEGYPTMGYGYHSTGKSTNFLKGIAEYQRKYPDRICGLIDAEGLYDPDWAEQLGVDTDRLIVSQPEYGEQAVDILEEMLGMQSLGIIVLDSIPSLVPMKVIENSAEDDTMAATARLMGKMCSKITMTNNRERRKGHWVSVWMVNQFRNKVGFVMGNPLHLPGGIQINHIPTTKIWWKLKKQEMTKDGYGNDVPDYNDQSFKLEKHKHGSSIQEGDFQVNLNPANANGLREGEFDNVPTVITFAKKMGFITGGGSSWRLLTENVGDGELSRFSKLAEIDAYLRANEEEYITLARSLIAMQRKSKGHTPLPPDGYLVSHYGRLVTLDNG